MPRSMRAQRDKIERRRSVFRTFFSFQSFLVVPESLQTFLYQERIDCSSRFI